MNETEWIKIVKRQFPPAIWENDEKIKSSLLLAGKKLAGLVQLPTLNSKFTMTAITNQAPDPNNNYTYDIPDYATFDYITSVFYDANPLDPDSNENIEAYNLANTSGGTPAFFCVYGSQFKIKPRPGETKTLTVYYQRQLTDIAQIDDRRVEMMMRAVKTFLYTEDQPGWVNAELIVKDEAKKMKPQERAVTDALPVYKKEQMRTQNAIYPHL